MEEASAHMRQGSRRTAVKDSMRAGVLEQGDLAGMHKEPCKIVEKVLDFL